jgi:3'(2'), 5'-bisphosphate nucleotidase
MNIENTHYLTAINAALEAGKAVMTIYASDFVTELKNDGSPITKADKLANEIICDALKTSGYPIISEESPKDSFNYRKEKDFVWLVDPVDGTREFTKRNNEFTVNIALVHNGLPVFGIVTAPALNQAWVGWSWQGAWKIESLNSIENLAPFTGIHSFLAHCKPIKTRKRPSRPIVALSLSHLSQNTIAMMKYLLGSTEDYEILQKGSSLKFCMVAEGSADFYLRADSINEWDTAAGQAVLEAAGGKIITWPDGNILRYNSDYLINPGFIVYGDPLFSDVLKAKLPFEKWI